MPRPDVLLLEGEESGHAMLHRYTAGGEFGGDTWHESVEAAERAAVEEYGAPTVGPWTPVPEDVPDAHDYAIAQAGARPAGARPIRGRGPDLEASSMHLRRLRLSLNRAMLAVAVVAATLAAGRFLVESLPHVRRCWGLAAREERLYRRAAFSWSQPLPTPMAVDPEDAALVDRYRCDIF